MEPAVEKRFERIESLLHAMTERENQMELRFNRRMDRAEERMEKFDRRLEATRKLVEAGMKMVLQIGQQQKVNGIELRRLEKSVEAFVNSMKRGGNGSRHS